MNTLGEEVNDEIVVENILINILPKYKNIAIIIEEIKILTTLNFD